MRTSNEIAMISQDKAVPSNVWEWLLLPFIIGLMTLSHIEGMSRIMVLYGVLLSWLFCLYFLYIRLELPVEIMLFFAWVVWAMIGMHKAADFNLYLTALTTVIQIGFLMFLVAEITALTSNISMVFFAITLGGVIVCLTGYYSGEFQLAATIDARTRAAGVTRNANDFAYHLLFSVFALFYFLRSKRSWTWRVFIAAAGALAVLGIIYSGSRKGYLGLLVFILLWFYFCHSRWTLRKPTVMFLVAMLLAGTLYLATDYVLSSTYLGKRFSTESLEHGFDTRWQMYAEGLQMIKSNPLFGVGLSHYELLSSEGSYSHSDYIEVAANTGMVGLLLYFSVYVLLWQRLNRIRTLSHDPRIHYVVGLLKAALLTILLVALGRPNLTSKLTWLFVAGAIGYAWSLECALRTLHRK